MKKIFYTLLLFLITLSISAQDAHYTMSFATATAYNPGMVGLTGSKYLFSSYYRNQYSELKVKYNTYNLVAEHLISTRKGKVGGLGLIFSQDNQNEFRSTTMSVAFAPDVLFFYRKTESDHRLRLGFQVGVLNLHFNPANYKFEDQFDGYGFDPYKENGENFSKQNRFLPLINFGFLYYNMPRVLKRSQINPFLGAAVTNALTLNYSFYNNGYSDQTFRVLAHAGVRISSKSAFEVTPLFSYVKQNYVQQFCGGLYVKYNLSNLFTTEHVDWKKAIMMSAQYKINTGVAFSVGVEFKDIAVGFGYDIITGDLRKGTSITEAFEMSIKYRIGKPFGNFCNSPIPIF